MNKRQRRYLTLALQESLKSTYTRVQIGAVIVDGNYVVSKAANLCTSHPRQYYYNNRVGRIAPEHNVHAEIHALVKSKDYDLSGTTMYIARYDRVGRLAMCRPCPACMEAIRQAGVQTIVYTTVGGIVHEVV